MTAPIAALADPIVRRCIVAELAARLHPTEGPQALKEGIEGGALDTDGKPMSRAQYARFFEALINAHLPEGARPYRITERQMQRHARGECACGNR